MFIISFCFAVFLTLSNQNFVDGPLLVPSLPSSVNGEVPSNELYAAGLCERERPGKGGQEATCGGEKVFVLVCCPWRLSVTPSSAYFLKNLWCPDFAILGILFQHIHLMLDQFSLQTISPDFVKEIIFLNFLFPLFCFCLRNSMDRRVWITSTMYF